MKQIVPILFFLFCWNLSDAQQSQQFSLFSFNPASFNPGATGMNPNVELIALYRAQWAGLRGAPRYGQVNLQMGAEPLGGGIGGFFQEERLGSFVIQTANLSYSYALDLNRYSRLRIGVSGAYQSRSLDGNLIRTPGGNYEGEIDHNDQSLLPGEVNASAFVFNAGLWYESSIWNIGVSVRNLADQTFDLGAADLSPGRAYYAFVGAKFDVGRNMVFEPSLLFKSILIQNQLDLNLKFTFNDNIILGGAFRGYDANSIDAASVFAGLVISEKIKIVYAYDIGLSQLNDVQNGSHEIVLAFDFGKPLWKGKLPPIIYNQRIKR